MSRILVVDDEKSICELLKITFEAEGFEVATAYSERDAIRKLDAFDPELLILDVMLPGASGFDICKKVTTEMHIPVILLTAKTELEDKVMGLELGADDYVTKPFQTRELIARVKALLRRANTNGEEQEDRNYIKNGEMEAFLDKHKIMFHSVEIELVTKEYELLLFFMKNIDQVFSRESLLERVWGYDYAGDTRTVDVHVQRLRKKLSDIREDIKDSENSDKYITTVFGVGYKMNQF